MVGAGYGRAARYRKGAGLDGSEKESLAAYDSKGQEVGGRERQEGGRQADAGR